ncbi:MAG: class I SAM-dependent methyltransferase [Myxococcales bacterium FL481]|nr:MAG: class I SAM-dependent methyltransferase [Myxococcales bacterium FL481]
MQEEPTLRPFDVIRAQVPLAGLRVADVGCGDGAVTRQLARAGAKSVVGVECSSEQLLRARSEAAADANPSFVTGVAEQLPLTSGSADLVVFVDSLHHVPVAAQTEALREVHRVLVPGGRAIVIEPLARGDYHEMLALVHDETEVRAHAQAAVATSVADGLFDRIATFEFLRRSSYSSYEEFHAGVVRVNPHRLERARAVDRAWREAFERVGRPSQRGWTFFSSSRVDVLRRPVVGDGEAADDLPIRSGLDIA